MELFITLTKGWVRTNVQTLAVSHCVLASEACSTHPAPDIQAKSNGFFFLHKANFVLFRFKFSDPHIKMKLFQAY